MTLEQFIARHSYRRVDYSKQEEVEKFLDDLSIVMDDVQDIYNAITIYGPQPAYHFYVKEKTEVEWPSLMTPANKLVDDIDKLNKG